MSKKFWSNKWLWIVSSLLAIGLLVLWSRKVKCSTGLYPWEGGLTADSKTDCSFWTGMPSGYEETPSTTNQQKSNCCQDADGGTCYPCVSIKCCGAGLRAGYLKNRDVIQTAPTGTETYTGGFRWDATEKKCYGYDAKGRAWVSDEECKSRNLI